MTQDIEEAFETVRDGHDHDCNSMLDDAGLYQARIQRLEAALREIDEGAECPGYVNGEEIVPWFVQIARNALSTKDTE